jgi:hypothetical protein
MENIETISASRLLDILLIVKTLKLLLADGKWKMDMASDQAPPA